jgi:hypothetical protein
VGTWSADANEVSVKGQAGQWREEWAAVVRWSIALHSVNTEANGPTLGRYAQGRTSGFQQAHAMLGAAMGWPDFMRWRRRP